MIRWLSIIVVIYMLAALTWWTVLLHRGQTKLTEAKERILQLEYDRVYGVKNFDISQLSDLEDIRAEQTSFQYMIHGEALVFALALILGIFYLYRLYRKELSIASQQKNFLLSITHELNSPLTSIKLVFETLKKRVLGTEHVQTLSTNGLEETHRLESLVDKLLFGAKLESSYSFNLEETDLNRFLDGIVSRYQQQFANYTFHLDTDTSITKKIDKEALTIMLNNLIENAMKYSPQQTEIHVSLTKHKDKAVIAVSDQGVGVDKKDLPYIFDQFYRSGSEETRTTKGTGIGLYISQQIAKAHNSKLNVKVGPNQKGSEFYLEL